MKNSTLTLLALAAFVFTTTTALSHAEAKTKKKKPVAAAAGPQMSGAGKGKKLSSSSDTPVSRDVVFDGSTVSGRYHSAGEAVTTVESEKKMNDLIGFRRDFKDRLTVQRAELKNGNGSVR